MPRRLQLINPITKSLQKAGEMSGNREKTLREPYERRKFTPLSIKIDITKVQVIFGAN
jgi:hypothetical protein